MSSSQRLTDWDDGSLQPAGLFNNQTSRGGFSLNSILNGSERSPSRAQSEAPKVPVDDPVRLGLVNSAIALSLFEQ
jgi:hypothetical protein